MSERSPRPTTPILFKGHEIPSNPEELPDWFQRAGWNLRFSVLTTLAVGLVVAAIAIVVVTGDAKNLDELNTISSLILGLFALFLGAFYFYLKDALVQARDYTDRSVKLRLLFALDRERALKEWSEHI